MIPLKNFWTSLRGTINQNYDYYQFITTFMEYKNYCENDIVADLVIEAAAKGLPSLPQEHIMPTQQVPGMNQNISRNPFLDPYWRLNHLYYIKDKNGQVVKFKFNKFQDDLWNDRWYNNIVVKARQLGVTTFYAILYLDAILFHENQTAGIIAHNVNDAKKIFEDMIRFAYNHLHEELKRIIAVTKDSADQLSFNNGSSIFVSVSTRSDTVQYLHVSEFGYTSLHYPEKAQEIMTGSLNSVHKKQMVSVESTAHGRQGQFFDLYQRAAQAEKEKSSLHEMDYKLFFFPWWRDSEYVLEADDPIPRELMGYFENLEASHYTKLSPAQRQWYLAKKKQMDDQIFSEYPSTADEAFLAPNQGAHYSKLMIKAMEEKRITRVPFVPNTPVETWWDIGINDYTVIIFTQTIGREIHFIDEYFNRGEGIAHYLDVLKNKSNELGYRYNHNAHYFPHDIEVQEWASGKRRIDVMRECGIYPLVAPKLPIHEGIDMVRGLFDRFWFDEEKCGRLIDALFNYRNAWDEKLGQFKDKPLHDEHSHFADALRVLGVMFRDISDLLPEKPEPFDRFELFNAFTK